MAQVILVEDQEIVRRAMTKLIERLGHKVQAYDDAASALAECDFAAADIILTDLSMPTRGEVLIQTVRRQGIKTPIMVYSGELNADSGENLKAIGAQAVVSKPIEIDILDKMIQGLL